MRCILSFCAAMSTCMLWCVTGMLSMPLKAHAVSCGTYEHGTCSGAPIQYAGGFNPHTGFGGFGGGNCTATKTPVIFIHGNGDNASSWDAPPGKVTDFAVPPRSIYAEMKARGYNDCELFGVTYLSDEEHKLKNVSGNYHRPEKYVIIRDFINAVKAYTGKPQVDIVAHSFGVTQTLAAIHVYHLDGSIRRFINIGGALKGLYSCYQTGFNSLTIPTCNSQNLMDGDIFGFFPEGFVGLLWVKNNWTGTGTSRSLRQAPKYHPTILFYTISASGKDELICSSTASLSDCGQLSKFDTAQNVKAQVNVGTGKDAAHIDLDWSNKSVFNLMGGDASNGVGHFRSKDNTGSIIQRMLLTDCAQLDCATEYSYGPKVLY
jgi:pimeloyl-ACP methyl ester carboxylesterase